MKDESLEVRIEVLEHNLKTLTVMLTDLAAETHTIRDHLPDSDSEAFDTAKKRHYEKILKHWESMRSPR